MVNLTIGPLLFRCLSSQTPAPSWSCLLGKSEYCEPTLLEHYLHDQPGFLEFAKHVLKFKLVMVSRDGLVGQLADRTMFVVTVLHCEGTH